MYYMYMAPIKTFQLVIVGKTKNSMFEGLDHIFLLLTYFTLVPSSAINNINAL